MGIGGPFPGGKEAGE